MSGHRAGGTVYFGGKGCAEARCDSLLPLISSLGRRIRFLGFRWLRIGHRYVLGLCVLLFLLLRFLVLVLLLRRLLAHLFATGSLFQRQQLVKRRRKGSKEKLADLGILLIRSFQLLSKMIS